MLKYSLWKLDVLSREKIKVLRDFWLKPSQEKEDSSEEIG
jgi:hypothetical protein